MTTMILDFLRMNGYGIYVWPAFGFAAIVLAWMGVATARRLKAADRALAQARAATVNRPGKP